MAQQYPLISCVCVTANRPHFLARAITCFEAQTYPNKELVILYMANDTLTSNILRQYAFNENIKLIAVDSPLKQTLGRLRNIAIEQACGELVCQWDDDDWFHTERLARQYEEIRQGLHSGCVMVRWILYYVPMKKAYLSGLRFWEGSILCNKKELLQTPYDDIVKGEDTCVIESLVSKKLLKTAYKSPQLYIYNYHGANTWDKDHFWAFISGGKELSASISLDIENILEQKYTVQQGSALLNEFSNKNMFY